MGVIQAALTGVNPSASNYIGWAVERNPDDFLTGALPTLTINPTNPLEVEVGTLAEGSFSIIAYCNRGGSNDWHQGKLLKVFNLVLTKVTIEASTITPIGNFMNNPNPPHEVFDTNPAMRVRASIVLEGGGADCKLGLNHVKLGWLANGVSTNWKVQYPSSKIGTETIAPETFPLLDSSRKNAGTGGTTAFRISSESFPLPNPPKGLKFEITAEDTPNEICFINFPNTTNHALSTDGSIGFIDYASGFSTDWDTTYIIAGRASWSARFKFTYDAANQVWADTGSVVNGPAVVDTTGLPRSAQAEGAVTVPPTFADSAHVDYT